MVIEIVEPVVVGRNGFSDDTPHEEIPTTSLSIADNSLP